MVDAYAASARRAASAAARSRTVDEREDRRPGAGETRLAPDARRRARRDRRARGGAGALARAGHSPAYPSRQPAARRRRRRWRARRVGGPARRPPIRWRRLDPLADSGHPRRRRRGPRRRGRRRRSAQAARSRRASATLGRAPPAAAQPPGGGRVGRAPAEAGPDRDPLLEREADEVGLAPMPASSPRQARLAVVERQPVPSPSTRRPEQPGIEEQTDRRGRGARTRLSSRWGRPPADRPPAARG